MIRALFASGAVLSFAAPALAERLLCMGISPGFLMVADGAATTFDYLGDGNFALDPPLPQRIEGWHATSLMAAQGGIPVLVEERTCRVAGVDLPIRIELGITTSRGLEPFVGCCLRSSG